MRHLLTGNGTSYLLSVDLKKNTHFFTQVKTGRVEMYLKYFLRNVWGGVEGSKKQDKGRGKKKDELQIGRLGPGSGKLS